MTGMQILLCDCGSEPFLIDELKRAFPGGHHDPQGPGLVISDFVLQPEAPPILVFSRQLLPDADLMEAKSISEWGGILLNAVAQLPEGTPWHLQIDPHYGRGAAGQQRCHLIRQTVLQGLQRHRRALLKTLVKRPEPFAVSHSLAQLLLVSPDRGYLSLAREPGPHQLRHTVWPFPKGDIPPAVDKATPSRAFAKLLEVELRMGQRVRAGESCVDLGAAPGSWSYVALQRGARVQAVDRAPLRPDLMAHPNLEFHRGDAFSYQPSQQVDWLLCDVIAAPARTIELLLNWVRQRRTRFFAVTIKFKGTSEYRLLEHVKHALPPLCDDFYLTHLSANRNEAAAFGAVRGSGYS